MYIYTYYLNNIINLQECIPTVYTLACLPTDAINYYSTRFRKTFRKDHGGEIIYVVNRILQMDYLHAATSRMRRYYYYYYYHIPRS